MTSTVVATVDAVSILHGAAAKHEGIEQLEVACQIVISSAMLRLMKKEVSCSKDVRVYDLLASTTLRLAVAHEMAFKCGHPEKSSVELLIGFPES